MKKTKNGITPVCASGKKPFMVYSVVTHDLSFRYRHTEACRNILNRQRYQISFPECGIGVGSRCSLGIARGERKDGDVGVLPDWRRSTNGGRTGSLLRVFRESLPESKRFSRLHEASSHASFMFLDFEQRRLQQLNSQGIIQKTEVQIIAAAEKMDQSVRQV